MNELDLLKGRLDEDLVNDLRERVEQSPMTRLRQQLPALQAVQREQMGMIERLLT